MPQQPNDTLAKLVTDRLYKDRTYREGLLVFEGQSVDTWFDVVHRDYNKIYDAATKKAHPNIRGYFGVTNLKVDACTAHLMTQYAHAIDAPFEFEVSQNPELNDKDALNVDLALDKILHTAMRERGLVFQDAYNPAGSGLSVLQKNGLFKPNVQAYLAEQKKKLVESRRELAIGTAKEAAQYHKNHVRDQLMTPQSGWNTAPIKFWRDWIKNPYAVMVGNEYKAIKDPVWTKDGIKFVDKTIPSYRCPNPWDIYIASDASNAQDGRGVTELLARSVADLIALKAMDNSHGYKADAIDKVLADKSYGGGSHWILHTDATTSRYTHLTGEDYLCMVHQGIVSADELSNHGITGYGKSKNDLYNCVIEVVGNSTIRLEVLKTPDNRRNYFSSSYIPSGSYAGVSIAMKAHERQMEINMLMFSKAENQWHSSGPNLFANANYFDDLENFQLNPNSLTMMRPNEVGAQNGRPLDTYQVQPIFRMLTQEVRELMVMTDEEVGVPSMFSGLSRGGASNNTLGGAVLQQTNGEKAMEAAVFGLDKTVFEPMFTQLHFNNLQSSDIPAQYKRGDLQVVGRGIFAKKRDELLRREQLQMRPMLDADMQRGLIPKPMFANALKNLYAGSGYDTQGMQGGAASSEISGIAELRKPDARTYTPIEQTLGIQQ